MHLHLLFVAISSACILESTKCQENSDDLDYDLNADYLDNGVVTPSGKLMGRTTEFYGVLAREYLGIPYAKPPVGDRRFRKPEQVDPWEGALAADTMPPACIQHTQVFSPWHHPENQSEDCLYLNIWSPRIAPEKTKVPVMFWIYGGGLTVGSNAAPIANGLGLAQLGRVLVVSPNYRVGPMGFFTSGTEDAPGNIGFYDMLEALQWTRKNIAAFGGDPDKITLFGKGAGSSAVSLLLLSPLTKGLFHRAIMQSGSFLSYIERDPNAFNLDLSETLAQAVGCSTDNQTLRENAKEVVECVRAVNASHLASALSSINPLSTVSFCPQYGDDFLPKDPREDFKAGKFHNVPLLIGINREEGSILLTQRYPELFGLTGNKQVDIGKSFAATVLRSQFRHLPDTEEVVHQFLDDADDDDYALIREQVFTAMGDYNITCPTVYFAEQFHDGNNTVQFYLFAERPSQSPFAPWMGVTLYDDVPFVFARPIEGYNYRTFMDYYTGELGLSYVTAKMWANFAKDGSADEVWKNYSRYHHQYLLIQYNTKKKMSGPGPHLDNCNFFRKYYDL